MEEKVEILLYSFNNFVTVFLYSYTFIIILLLIGSLLKKEIKNEAFNLMYVINFLMAWMTILSMLIYAYDLFTAWYAQNQYEVWVFSEKGYVEDTWGLVYLLISICLVVIFYHIANKKKRLPYPSVFLK